MSYQHRRRQIISGHARARAVRAYCIRRALSDAREAIRDQGHAQALPCYSSEPDVALAAGAALAHRLRRPIVVARTPQPHCTDVHYTYATQIDGLMPFDEPCATCLPPSPHHRPRLPEGADPS